MSFKPHEDSTNASTRGTSKHFIVYWAPVILWAGMIFFFSTDEFSSSNTSTFFEPLFSAVFSGITFDRFEAVHFVIRKSAHLTEYFIFSLLLIRALTAGFKAKLDAIRAVSILAAVLLYALSDEFHQIFVPSRTASLADVGIDWFAGICGILWSYLGANGNSCATDAAPECDNRPEICKKP